MSYTFITDPVSKNVYSIHSELGRNLLKSYISQVGGADDELKDELPEDTEDISEDIEKVSEDIEKVSEDIEKVSEDTPKDDTKPIKVEDKSWARFKSQWLIWIGNRFKEMGDLFNTVGNSQSPVEEQFGGDGNQYIKKILTFIV